MCETLGLSEAEYKLFLVEAVESAKATMGRSSYVTFAEKARDAWLETDSRSLG